MGDCVKTICRLGKHCPQQSWAKMGLRGGSANPTQGSTDLLPGHLICASFLVRFATYLTNYHLHKVLFHHIEIYVNNLICFEYLKSHLINFFYVYNIDKIEACIKIVPYTHTYTCGNISS